MKPPTRDVHWVLVLFAVTLLFWAAALLDLLRLYYGLLWFLLKRFPGPWVVLGAMLICPLAAAVLGWRMSAHGGRRRFLGRLSCGVGSLFVLVWIATIGHAHWDKVLGPKPPQNPKSPRSVESLVGLPVFPGAEGFGTRTRAGRGGKVIEVTSLADRGAGTLRAALEDPGPRTIVFRVGGTIELREHLYIAWPFVTVAGQTAPGDGIGIKNAGIVILTHDVLVQHLRVRPGNEGKVDADTNDAIQILGRHGKVDGAWNVVLDHLSASWAEDETVSTWYGAHDVTLSWCIISEALNRSRHRKQTHSAGLLIGDRSYHVSVHHCLLAHHDFRNPLIIDGGTHDLVNNVIYNWGAIPAEIVDHDANTFLNFVGNDFLPGPSSQIRFCGVIVNPGSRSGAPRIYLQGNVGPVRPEGLPGEWALVNVGWSRTGIPPDTYRSPAAFGTPPITVSTAAEARERVLGEAGATLPTRDPVDARVIDTVRNRTGSIIDSPQQVGGYPALRNGTAPLDSDRDGMPDVWEQSQGLNPADASDGRGDLDHDGYTNLEEYLHSLTNATPVSQPTAPNGTLQCNGSSRMP